MGLVFGASAHRAERTATLPSLQSGWAESFRFVFTTFAANSRRGVSSLSRADTAFSYAFLVQENDSSNLLNTLALDYDFTGGAFQYSGDATDRLSPSDDRFIHWRHTPGGPIRVYIDGVERVTSNSGTFDADAPLYLRYGNNGLDPDCVLGTMCALKRWTVDRAPATLDGQYRNPQNDAANCWEAWHGKTGQVGTGNRNGRDLTLTGVTFGADPATILGDDPPPPYTEEHEGYRWRADDGSESAATWLAAQDTGITRAAGQAARLRAIVNASGDPAAGQYELQVRRVGTTDWRAVPPA